MRLEDLKGYRGIKKFAQEKGVMIAITPACDCSCEHCGVKLYQKKNAKVLTTVEIKEKILDRMGDMGFKVAYFFGGEPTLHKDFIELLRYSTKIGLYTRFDTNGHKLSNLDFVNKVKDTGITFLLVSIDSASAEVHDRFRGVKGSWEMAVQGIKNCVKMGIQVGISTVVTKQSLKKGDLKRIIQLGKELGVFKIRTLAPIMIGRWYKENVKLTPQEMKQLFSLLEPNFVFWEEWCDGTVPIVCSSITRWFFFVSFYGDIQPCCYIPIRFGNIRNEDINSIVKRMWETSFFKVKAANINRCDCPMNNKNIRSRIMKMLAGKRKFPIDYNESIFRAE